MRRKLTINPQKNTVVWGDNKDWLKYVPTSSVNLIYIDPPFFSNRKHEVLWGNGFELRSYGDRWKGGMEHYIAWMRERLIEAKRVLHTNGSIFLHCDWRASHRLRCLLDEVFEEKNFLNELIWCYGSGGVSKKHFSKKHDTIFWYKKIKNHTFNFNESREAYKEKCKVKYKIVNGKKYKRKNEMGRIPFDWFEIPIITNTAFERIGYPTQKPEKLLKKIIIASTNLNDSILDFFGGGGTTAKIAYDLNRKFIIGDVSPVACRVTIDRLKKAGCKDFEAKQIPATKEEWHLIKGHRFAEMICEFMGWECNPKKSNDCGIDGWTSKKRIPVQIKHQRGSTGRDNLQAFVGALGDSDKGIFVAWNFSPKAWDYIHVAKKKFNKDIELIPAHQILGELVLTEQERVKYQKLYEKSIKASKTQKARPDYLETA